MAASPCQPSTIAPQSMEIDVALDQHAAARDAVHDLVVDRGADRRRGTAGGRSPGTTARRRATRMWSSAIASSSPVVTPGRRPRAAAPGSPPTSRPAIRIRSIWSGVLISSARSSRAHQRPRQLCGTTSSASKIRWVTSSTSPIPSISWTMPRSPVHADQRLGLLAVDLLAATDDVLGVVGAALDLRALEQPRHELVLVDGEHDDGVEPVPGEGRSSRRAPRPGPACAGSRRAGSRGRRRARRCGRGPSGW